MDRKKVLLDEAQTLRQREFERKIAEIHRSRGKTPLAMVDTFGCQQNVADSQHIMGMLEAMGCGFTDRPEQADIVVLNTCAIRDHAEKRVYGNLGALTHTKKANPEPCQLPQRPARWFSGSSAGFSPPPRRGGAMGRDMQKYRLSSAT